MHWHCDGSGSNGRKDSKARWCVVALDGWCEQSGTTTTMQNNKTYVWEDTSGMDALTTELMSIFFAAELAKPGDVIYNDCFAAINGVLGKNEPRNYHGPCVAARKVIRVKHLKIRKVARERNEAGIYLDLTKRHPVYVKR